jgi:hypothetical protein
MHMPSTSPHCHVDSMRAQLESASLPSSKLSNTQPHLPYSHILPSPLQQKVAACTSYNLYSLTISPSGPPLLQTRPPPLPACGCHPPLALAQRQPSAEAPQPPCLPLPLPASLSWSHPTGTSGPAGTPATWKHRQAGMQGSDGYCSQPASQQEEGCLQQSRPPHYDAACVNCAI